MEAAEDAATPYMYADAADDIPTLVKIAHPRKFYAET